MSDTRQQADQVVAALRRMGWDVVTKGPGLTNDLGRGAPTPAFRAWGHPRYPRSHPLYGVLLKGPNTTVRELRALWSAGATDIWVVGAIPGLSSWEMFSAALRGVPRGHRVLCARPEELGNGMSLAIVSQEPDWMASPQALQTPTGPRPGAGLGFSQGKPATDFH